MDDHINLASKKYAVFRKLLSADTCRRVTQAVYRSVQSGHLKSGDKWVQQCFTKYAHPLTEDLLLDLLPFMQEQTGKELEPTYSYVRVYLSGADLKKHTDREACEYSVTATLATDPAPWAFWIDNGTERASILLSPGDALLFMGRECPHWREPFQGRWILQAFFHYVDSNGPFADLRFDRRQGLNLTSRLVSNSP